MSYHRVCCCVAPDCDAVTASSKAVEVQVVGVNSSVCTQCHGTNVIRLVTFSSVNIDGTYLAGGSSGVFQSSTSTPLSNPGYQVGTTYFPEGACLNEDPFQDPDCIWFLITVNVTIATQQVTLVEINSWTHPSNPCALSGNLYTFRYNSAVHGGTYNVGDFIPNGIVCGGVGSSSQDAADGGFVRICAGELDPCTQCGGVCEAVNDPSPDSWDVTLSGVTHCCTVANEQITTPSNINKTETLTRNGCATAPSGDTACRWSFTEAGVLTTFVSAGCTGGTASTVNGIVTWNLLIWLEPATLLIKTNLVINLDITGGSPVNLFASDILTISDCGSNIVALNNLICGGVFQGGGGGSASIVATP